MNSARPFWYVFNITQGGAPTMRHYSGIVARREADRLARAFPGNTFIVLKAIYSAHAVPPAPQEPTLQTCDMSGFPPWWA